MKLDQVANVTGQEGSSNVVAGHDFFMIFLVTRPLPVVIFK